MYQRSYSEHDGLNRYLGNHLATVPSFSSIHNHPRANTPQQMMNVCSVSPVVPLARPPSSLSKQDITHAGSEYYSSSSRSVTPDPGFLPGPTRNYSPAHSPSFTHPMFPASVPSPPPYFSSSRLVAHRKRKRRAKEQLKFEHVCGCGKGYASPAALYTHVKQKHDGVQPSGTKVPPALRKRGRPRKHPNPDVLSKSSSSSVPAAKHRRTDDNNDDGNFEASDTQRHEQPSASSSSSSETVKAAPQPVVPSSVSAFEPSSAVRSGVNVVTAVPTPSRPLSAVSGSSNNVSNHVVTVSVTPSPVPFSSSPPVPVPQHPSLLMPSPSRPMNTVSVVERHVPRQASRPYMHWEQEGSPVEPMFVSPRLHPAWTAEVRLPTTFRLLGALSGPAALPYTGFPTLIDGKTPHPLQQKMLDRLTMPPTNRYTPSTCDEVLIQYLLLHNELVDGEFYQKIVRNVCNFRLCLNTVGWTFIRQILLNSGDANSLEHFMRTTAHMTEEFCDVAGPDIVPTVFEYYVTVFLPQKCSTSSTRDLELAAGLTRHLCDWMFENRYTGYRTELENERV
eukprot:GILK01009562.1.p1 GENE.GILK01009562.1~~GILK01009562.1.p1  ORF type:complete len:561 (-),score=71.03 GILK01009562.1:361-2043(-)